MIILGLNINHADTSACLIVDGRIIAAIEEERFVRKKHFAGFPVNAIEFCLDFAKIQLKQVDFVTLNFLPSANLKKKFLYGIKNIFSSAMINKFINC